MANAGCINAIGFDGTYLRTLNTLDSANIGVGVQYCIPAPLDDKRLDYIKYTDKCGCTCCITGENEILVYATQGVIKNFTLTNDDTNEVVNVKWNDLFGSNRAYTMVRYKTGSYPTSITDGTLAVKETTQNQYSVSGYNVSGLTDGTTYYFTAFAVSQDGTIIVVQTKSIETDFDPKKSLSNILVYYDMKGNLNDTGGNGYNLSTVRGSVSYGTQYITVSNRIGNNASITYSSTVSYTMNMRTDFPRFCMGDDADSGGNRGLQISDRAYCVIGGNLYETTAPTVSAGRHMFSTVFDYSAKLLKYYVDGELKATKSLPNGGLRCTNKIVMGNNRRNGTFGMTGNIGISFIVQNASTDLLSFYNRTKSKYGL